MAPMPFKFPKSLESILKSILVGYEPVSSLFLLFLLFSCDMQGNLGGLTRRSGTFSQTTVVLAWQLQDVSLKESTLLVLLFLYISPKQSPFLVIRSFKLVSMTTNPFGEIRRDVPDQRLFASSFFLSHKCNDSIKLDTYDCY